jgi:hypothetical protein
MPRPILLSLLFLSHPRLAIQVPIVIDSGPSRPSLIFIHDWLYTSRLFKAEAYLALTTCSSPPTPTSYDSGLASEPQASTDSNHAELTTLDFYREGCFVQAKTILYDWYLVQLAVRLCMYRYDQRAKRPRYGTDGQTRPNFKFEYVDYVQ